MALAPFQSREIHYEIRGGIGIELKSTNSVLYASPVSDIQEQIELSVTNGRGYSNLRGSVDIVNGNPHAPKLTIFDVLEGGLIPLYFGGPRRYGSISDKHPCGEIPLGKPSPTAFPAPIRKPTLLEEVEMIQRVKSRGKSCFDHEPIEPRESYWIH